MEPLERGEQEERARLRRQMRQARTRADVAEARAALHAWLELHPDDIVILREGEGVAMVESAFLEIDKLRAGAAHAEGLTAP